MISPWQLLALRENTAAMDVSANLQIHAVKIKKLDVRARSSPFCGHYFMTCRAGNIVFFQISRNYT